MKVDVIIPIYKPGKELFELLDKLTSQSLPPEEIILMNTEEKYFEELIYGTDFLKKYKNVRVFHLSKREFDHGNTRRFGVKKSKSEYFIMMTQDAVPQDEYMIEKMISAFKDKIACVYARQLPKQDCCIEERLSRGFNYPETSYVKSLEDLADMGIKTYFCSNVCAAYDRAIYDKTGGFVKRAIFNEDMIYAANVMKAGYKVAYCAEAKVYHSHNYSNMQQFHRNFDLGVSQAEHPEIFKNIPSEKEGKRMVKTTTAYLKNNKLKRRIPHFYIQCASKYAGYVLGKNYRKLPKCLILKITSNKEYWKK